MLRSAAASLRDWPACSLVHREQAVILILILGYQSGLRGVALTLDAPLLAVTSPHRGEKGASFFSHTLDWLPTMTPSSEFFLYP
jgi:hypothetical protein